MPPLGTNWNPSAVMMGQPQNPGSPYINPNKPKLGPMPIDPTLKPGSTSSGQYSGAPASLTVTGTQAPRGTTLGPESVRATGAGPFDPAYRQNLAAYAGGQFARPAGGLNFNPTNPSTFPGLATGGGTAPVTGMPASLMDMALGGQGFSWMPPPAQTAPPPPQFGDMQTWLDQFMKNGRGQRQRSPMQ